MVSDDKLADTLMKRVRKDAVDAMNETSLAQVVKKMKKG